MKIKVDILKKLKKFFGYGEIEELTPQEQEELAELEKEASRSVPPRLKLDKMTEEEKEALRKKVEWKEVDKDHWKNIPPGTCVSINYAGSGLRGIIDNFITRNHFR